MGMDNSDDNDYVATKFFEDSYRNTNSSPSSESDLKNVGHALADNYLDEESDIKLGALYSEIQSKSGLPIILYQPAHI